MNKVLHVAKKITFIKAQEEGCKNAKILQGIEYISFPSIDFYQNMDMLLG